MFKYDSFTFDETETQEQFLECIMNVCVDNQPCTANQKEENCPTTGIDGLFGFSLFGRPNTFQLPVFEEQV